MRLLGFVRVHGRTWVYGSFPRRLVPWRRICLISVSLVDAYSKFDEHGAWGERKGAQPASVRAYNQENMYYFSLQGASERFSTPESAWIFPG